MEGVYVTCELLGVMDVCTAGKDRLSGLVEADAVYSLHGLLISDGRNTNDTQRRRFLLICFCSSDYIIVKDPLICVLADIICFSFLRLSVRGLRFPNGRSVEKLLQVVLVMFYAMKLIFVTLCTSSL